MIRVLFICHGNICRSPMAEFVFKDMLEKKHLSDRFFVASAATSTEELGNPVHRGTKAKLASLGISCEGKRAVQMKKSDYAQYDYLIAMDDWNVRNIQIILGGDPEHKVSKLLSFAGSSRDIADPWYTGNFDETYDDILCGLKGFLKTVYPDF